MILLLSFMKYSELTKELKCENQEIIKTLFIKPFKYQGTSLA
jgi:hypothetical protein